VASRGPGDGLGGVGQEERLREVADMLVEFPEGTTIKTNKQQIKNQQQQQQQKKKMRGRTLTTTTTKYINIYVFFKKKSEVRLGRLKGVESRQRRLAPRPKDDALLAVADDVAEVDGVEADAVLELAGRVDHGQRGWLRLGLGPLPDAHVLGRTWWRVGMEGRGEERPKKERQTERDVLVHTTTTTTTTNAHLQ